MKETHAETYDYRLLRQRFYNRLITQDRVSRDFVFPIRLLIKVFASCKDKRLCKWFNDGIEKMKFDIENNSENEFQNLTSLTIYQDNTVSVTVSSDQNSHALFTQVIPRRWMQNNVPRPMMVHDIREITIDHTVQMNQVFMNFETDFPELTKLSDDILRWGYYEDITMSQRNAANWSALYFRQRIVDKPIEERKELLDKLYLEIVKINPVYRLVEAKENLSRT